MADRPRWTMTVEAHGDTFDLLRHAAGEVLRAIERAKSYREMPICAGFSGGPGYEGGWSCTYTCPDEDKIKQLRKEANDLESNLRGEMPAAVSK